MTSKSITRIVPVTVFAFIGVLSTESAKALSLSYNDFSSTAGLTLNGTASQVGNAIRITSATTSQSGSFFSTSPVTLAGDVSFSSAFQFRITNPGGAGGGADGLTFTVQTVSDTAGGIGQGIGYAGIGNSLAIEFDTYFNLGLDETGGSNHVGIDLNGSVDSVVSTGELSPNFDNGNVWYAWVDYNGLTDTLEARWSDTNNRPSSAGLSLIVDLTTVLQTPNVFVGFTSATGSGYGNHDILAWQFNDTFAPIGAVPEPGVLGLMGIGFLAAVRMRRKTQ